MTCTHSKPRRWIDASYVDDEGYQHISGEWEDGDSLFVDIGLHRYKCTGCGEVGYYSSRARAYFEDGVGSLP